MSAPRHHRARGFQNNYIEFEPRSLADVLRWRVAAAREGLPRPPSAPIPQLPPSLDFLRANASGPGQQAAVTWIGHATVLAQFGGISLLTDPVFSERCSPFSFAGPKRHQPPAIALADLPHIDLVVVSHNHYDHLDRPSVEALGRQPGGSALFVVPLGLAAWFRDLGLDNVVELDWWQSHPLAVPGRADVDVMLVPAQHWSARGLRDRMQTLWGGFAVLAQDCHLFFAGDTGYSRDFADIRQRLAARQGAAQGGGFDIALLPIGAYAPRWFMATQHIDVAEAVKIHLDIGAKRSLGIHWGTFELTDEPLDEPPQRLTEEREAQRIDEDAFFTVAIGGTRRLPPRA
ncbi:MBL fold metallo-hydrolase [Variovorax sp. dw_954]|uniref:MBL fold metallo-hydrolase n=1 Tax=Variovorax sp. dw_954 TaxID=2720078 RepID=UPI001BD6CABD|nr:MBL fold metallo-hydrolase [Variovorax sp. dw_954]